MPNSLKYFKYFTHHIVKDNFQTPHKNIGMTGSASLYLSFLRNKRPLPNKETILFQDIWGELSGLRLLAKVLALWTLKGIFPMTPKGKLSSPIVPMLLGTPSVCLPNRGGSYPTPLDSCINDLVLKFPHLWTRFFLCWKDLQ